MSSINLHHQLLYGIKNHDRILLYMGRGRPIPGIRLANVRGDSAENLRNYSRRYITKSDGNSIKQAVKNPKNIRNSSQRNYYTPKTYSKSNMYNENRSSNNSNNYSSPRSSSSGRASSSSRSSYSSRSSGSRSSSSRSSSSRRN